MKKQILTVIEVAEYLKISDSSVYKLARKGKIPAFKILNKWRFDIDLIDKLIESKNFKINV